VVAVASAAVSVVVVLPAPPLLDEFVVVGVPAGVLPPLGSMAFVQARENPKNPGNSRLATLMLCRNPEAHSVVQHSDEKVLYQHDFVFVVAGSTVLLEN
jgi:hypothetical protein